MIVALNEGKVDRITRTAVGFGLLFAGFSGFLPVALGNAATLIGLVALGTALAGWCPLYTLLHVDTSRR